jgi:integrase
MATTYRNEGSKFWYARFNNKDGRRISRTTKSETRREAKKIAADMESAERKAARMDNEVPQMVFRTLQIASLELQQGTLSVQRAEDLIRQMVRTAVPNAEDGSFRRFAGAWLDIKERDGIALSTWKNYRDGIKLFVAHLGAKAEGALHKIGVADIETFQAVLSDSGQKSKTANGHVSTIRRILESAVEKGLLARNPAKPVRGIKKSDSTQRVPFTLAEVQRLITHAPSDEWRGLITLGAHTGLRCGDLLRLNAANIVGTVIKLQPDKTEDSTGAVLTIPLSPPCLAWIKDRTDDLFPAIKKKKKSNTSETFNRIMRDAGIAKVVVLVAGDRPVTATKSFHSLRHSFTSWLAEADIHADVRSKLTGHSSAKVHAGYTHHDEALVRAIQALPIL